MFVKIQNLKNHNLASKGVKATFKMWWEASEFLLCESSEQEWSLWKGSWVKRLKYAKAHKDWIEDFWSVESVLFWKISFFSHTYFLYFQVGSGRFRFILKRLRNKYGWSLILVVASDFCTVLYSIFNIDLSAQTLKMFHIWAMHHNCQNPSNGFRAAAVVWYVLGVIPEPPDGDQVSVLWAPVCFLQKLETKAGQLLVFVYRLTVMPSLICIGGILLFFVRLHKPKCGFEVELV